MREFEQADAEIFRVTKTRAYGLEVAKVIAEALRKAGVDARVATMVEEVRGDVVVHGDVVAVDGGIAALRVWVGFGAGASKFRVQGRVVGSNGGVIGDFNRERRSGIGDTDGSVQKCIEAVGYDIATMMTTGRYTTGDD